jgi:hypothetical protein
MNDPAPCGHPLHVARIDDPTVPDAISMFHHPTKDIGNGLNAPMGMPRKTLEEMFGIIRPEIVEKEEWIELNHFIVTEGSFKMDPSPFDCWPAFPHFINFSYSGHRMSILSGFQDLNSDSSPFMFMVYFVLENPIT